VRAIADTGFLVAFASRTDQHHNWALDLASRIDEPLLTCESVLSEAGFHLGGAIEALDFVTDGLVCPAFNAADHMDRLVELATRYADRHPDFADLCLICMSELHPTYPVITTDVKDFRVYRRGQRGVIPLITPAPVH
jgi:hypothetical protein